eukprot:gene9564-10571_t
MSWATERLGERLFVKQQDNPIEIVCHNTEEVLSGKKFVGLYFSAHWCGPCRAFTPKLATFYSAMKERDPNALEIVFVSFDHDKHSAEQYFAHEMSWLAVDLSDSTFREELGNHYSVQGIPTLVVLNNATGEIIDEEGVDALRTRNFDVDKVKERWEEWSKKSDD